MKAQSPAIPSPLTSAAIVEVNRIPDETRTAAVRPGAPPNAIGQPAIPPGGAE